MRLTTRITTLIFGTLILLFTASVNAAEPGTTTTTMTTTTKPDGSTTVVKKVITTPAPKSESCTTIAAHWEDNVWIDQQTVCKYAGRSEGLAWVQDYWACTSSTDAGDCNAWEFRPGYWVKVTQ